MKNFIKFLVYDKFISIIIVMIILGIISLIYLFTTVNFKGVIYLDKCYRVAEDSIIFTPNNVFYLQYKDCKTEPRKIKINGYIFIEK